MLCSQNLKNLPVALLQGKPLSTKPIVDCNKKYASKNPLDTEHDQHEEEWQESPRDQNQPIKQLSMDNNNPIRS